MPPKKGLGRGLNSLFSVFDESDEEASTTAPINVPKATEVQTEVQAANPETGEVSAKVLEIDLSRIEPNVNQPRKNFDQEALNELAASIKMHGVIQPIVVCKRDDGSYMIIAGERRYRASKLAGLKTIPSIVKTYTDKQIKEVSIIENLQREDLNPIEAARAMKQLMDDYKWTQETVADRIGKSRPAVANILRLLSLPYEVIRLIEDNRLSAGHAKCLVALTNSETQIQFAKAACDNKLSVRDLEKAIKIASDPQSTRKKTEPGQSLELKELITTMQRTFATKVSALGNDNRGRIYIDYYSRDDLDRINDLIETLSKRSTPSTKM